MHQQPTNLEPTTMLNTQQAIERVRNGLRRLDVTEIAPNQWTRETRQGRIAVTLAGDGNPYFIAGPGMTDVMFFDFGASEQLDRAMMNALFLWVSQRASGRVPPAAVATDPVLDPVMF
jgi:hypothetical protein